jgi:hypothetical protein
MSCFGYWTAGRSRPADPTWPDMRVSDAERSEVSDLLSRHFSDGRLDQAEFDERLHGAMSAKTRGDLAGLFDDLPPLVDTAEPTPSPRRMRGRFTLFMVTLFIFAAAFTSAAWAWHFPWLLFAIIFFVFWRRSHWGRWGWHRHRAYGPPPWYGGTGGYGSYSGRRGTWI